MTFVPERNAPVHDTQQQSKASPRVVEIRLVHELAKSILRGPIADLTFECRSRYLAIPSLIARPGALRQRFSSPRRVNEPAERQRPRDFERACRCQISDDDALEPRRRCPLLGEDSDRQQITVAAKPDPAGSAMP